MKKQSPTKSAKVRLPIVSKKRFVVPIGSKCPWCSDASRLKANSFAVLHGGALQPDETSKCSVENELLRGYLNLDWQGSVAVDGTDSGTGVSVAYEVAGGGFILNFCGTECLRAFLNYCVDELERKVERVKRSRKLQTKSLLPRAKLESHR